jgi:hypothetical protein
MREPGWCGPTETIFGCQFVRLLPHRSIVRTRLSAGKAIFGEEPVNPSSRAGFHRALHPHPRAWSAVRARLGARDQTRRLSAQVRREGRQGAPFHEARLRLDQALPGYRDHRRRLPCPVSLLLHFADALLGAQPALHHFAQAT